MTIEEAIQNRHTVRKYLNRKLSAEIVAQLTDRLQQSNARYGIHMRLITDNTDAFSPILKLVLAKGVQNYIVLAGRNTPDMEERLGYCGIDAALFAQTLGLNSWWVGGTFSRNKVARTAMIPADERVTGIIAVGYGANQGVPHRSKTAEQISSYNGTPPEWFRRGISFVLLAPSALNKQAFRIRGDGDAVSIVCENGAFSATDLWIAKYHFEAGAGRDNFHWM